MSQPLVKKRHMPRYSSSRQKACQQCSIAKAKCDRNLRGCARCGRRDLTCAYPQVSSPGPSVQHATLGSGTYFSGALFTTYLGSTPGPAHSETTRAVRSTGSTNNGSPARTALTHTNAGSDLDPAEQEPVDFSNLDLLCPINVDDIGSRWLNSYVPLPGQTIKEYPPSIIAFVHRILKSYIAVVIRGRGIPPFVHSLQMEPQCRSPPLPTCFSVVRILEGPLPDSEHAAVEIIQQQMNKLYEQQEAYNGLAQLAAFQSYLIYSMALFFHLGPSSAQFLRQAMMNLQEMACSCCRRGLMCSMEQQNARPRWEAWVVAEAKRRTLYVVYLFDSVLSAQEGLPNFLGVELEGLPTSASKLLWEARGRREWETEYNLHLGRWSTGGLRIDELWPIPAGFDEARVDERRKRVDTWLEDIDEFGTVLYAVTSCTHGG